MSDFTSGFWNGYVIVLTLASIAYCAWLLLVTSRTRVKPGAAPAVSKGTKVELHGHTWDGDLAELNNPLPRWWMWLFYITIVFSLAYLVLYPGLGKLPGALGWTSVGEHASEIADFDARQAPLYAKYSAMDIPHVAVDPLAHAMGERLFLANCAQCHGSDAGGGKGFPNLRDNDWEYGGDPVSIKESITNGRNGIMPPFGPILGDNGVKNVAHYVRSLSGLPADSLRVQIGKPIFMQNCAACHGADGKGNQQIGAPNLTDQIWLYGGTEATIVETITKGRGEASAITRMPAHKDLLDPGKIHLLTAYVWGLSNAKLAAP